ncbi:MAG: site-2 protease family protein [Pseudomonadota bacterium]
MPDFASWLAVLAVLACVVPAVLAITVHEVAHGAAALWLGDDTASRRGRLTINPLPHIDPVGTLAVPALLLVASTFVLGVPFAFGWAKPVPVIPARLRRPRRDLGLVAAAGPAANALMALAWVAVLKLLFLLKLAPTWPPGNLALMAEVGILINLGVGLFNLLPLPPMDGSRIVSSLMPETAARKFDRIGQHRLILLGVMVLLLASGALAAILLPPMEAVAGLIERVAGVRLRYL